MQLRTLHTYLGMLIAPTVIFMAGTGLMQIYSLHEAHPGYTPPPLIEALGSVHKDQRLSGGHEDHPPAARSATTEASHDQPPHAPKVHSPRAEIATALLKAFFTFVALALILSSGIGVWMGLRAPLRRRTCLLLLGLGAVVPIVLAVLTA